MPETVTLQTASYTTPRDTTVSDLALRVPPRCDKGVEIRYCESILATSATDKNRRVEDVPGSGVRTEVL